jgi:hypothetical protein
VGNHQGGPEPSGASTKRVHRFRAKKRAERAEAERLAKIAKRDERDQKRIAKGLLPLVEANRVKVAKFRAKRVALKEMVAESWFAPALAREVFIQEEKSKHPNWDAAFINMFVDGSLASCRGAGFNLNRYTAVKDLEDVKRERTVFSELFEAGVPILDALNIAKTEPFTPNGNTQFERSTDRRNRYVAACRQWGCGEKIAELLLNK